MPRLGAGGVLLSKRRQGVFPPAGPAAFDPTSIAGLQAGFWADAGTSTVIDGVAVSQWNDQSGNARHAVQATGTKQPLYKTAIQNGLPGILFDSLDDSLDSTGWSIAQPDTIYVVCKALSTKQFAGAFDGITTRQAIFASVAPAKWAMFAGTEIDSATVLDTNAHVLSVILNGASSQLWLDGVSIATGNAGANALNGLRLGSSDQTSTTTWNGYLFQWLGYSGAHSVGNRQTVEAGLKAKWGTP